MWSSTHIVHPHDHIIWFGIGGFDISGWLAVNNVGSYHIYFSTAEYEPVLRLGSIVAVVVDGGAKQVETISVDDGHTPVHQDDIAFLLTTRSL